MKNVTNDNAANRYSYVGHNYCLGEKAYKEDVLNKLPKQWSDLHREGYIHIHDLDAYGLTYNCLALNLVPNINYNEFNGLSDTGKILHLFNYIRILLTKIGNEQSGGMAFANFDIELDQILSNLHLCDNILNTEVIKSCIREFVIWCNNDHTRMGRTSYYITLNIGLAQTRRAQDIAFALLDEFEKLGDMVFKPNIVFKVCDGINMKDTDPNHYLLLKSLEVTSKKMIPTYIICNSDTNRNIDPEKLAIMGCRSRVVADLYGCNGAVGRGNIANVTINLPKIALEIDQKNPDKDIASKYEKFVEFLDIIVSSVSQILIDRLQKTSKLSKECFPTNLETQLWCESFNTNSLLNVFRHGTLAIGFIGLSEAIEVITTKKYYSSKENYKLAIKIVEHMRKLCDYHKDISGYNFSLLATAGELISGRFIGLDRKKYTQKVDIFSKGFYTNSFHIDVDSGLSGFIKIELEGKFHELCNGGCITYLELREAPLGNTEALLEYIETATQSGIHYLGFNFPKDICKRCNTRGVFDICPTCGGNQITRIRRVSGYLEILDGFTPGKKKEVEHRLSN